MKVVYIAGPFTGATAWDVEQNVRRAEEEALAVAHLGAAPLCPHANSRYFHGQLTPEFWYEATLELLRRCDAVLVVGSYRTSRGTLREIEEARARGVPTFYDLNKLEVWLES